MSRTDAATLVDFLLRAKAATYASQGDDATVAPLLPASRQLEYREGSWLYRDVYFGMAAFVGQETVYHDDRLLWAMSYAGGMLRDAEDPALTREVYAFLRSALRAVPRDAPFRGPAELAAGAWRYRNAIEGGLTRFAGRETIAREGTNVYALRYAGGDLR